MVLKKEFNKKEWITVATFLAAWFILVFFFWVKDYGVPFDELAVRGSGGVSAKYVLSKVYPSYIEQHPEIKALPNLHEHFDRNYGVAFELPAVILEKAIGFDEHEQGFLIFRHRLKFLLFFLASITFYFLLKSLTGNWPLAFAGLLILVVNPRTFGDSIYNSKDGAFMSACMLATWALFRFLDERTLLNALLVAILGAFATGIRVIGFLIPMTALGWFVLEWLFAKDRMFLLRTQWKPLLLILVVFPIVTYVIWPFLWENPVRNFLSVLLDSAKFSHYDGSEFMFGVLYPVKNLPWFYLPVWMGISIPIAYLVFILTGTVKAFTGIPAFFKKPKGNTAEVKLLLLLVLILVPTVSAVMLKAILYSGWRHFYFIWPWLVILAVCGIGEIKNLLEKIPAEWIRQRRESITFAIAFTLCGWMGIRIMINHPYECVYFNAFAGHSAYIESHHTLDYWGLSYPEALRALPKIAKEDSIITTVAAYPGKTNLIMVKHPDRERIFEIPVDDPEAIHHGEYFVGFIPGRHPKEMPETEEIYAVKAWGFRINQVLKRKN